ncbi:MAG TPA: CHASE2 domain-containing protein [Bacteroidales bacterium]|nr:CHASE2 domain-containing protein [Bacteroidales bacterium]HSA42331.1 CHASE2 domain-containing protein [Bacteroidales bacterium]
MKRTVHRRLFIAIFLVVNTLICVLLSFMLMNISYLNKHHHELDVIFTGNYLKHFLLGREDAWPVEDYLFIDLAYQKSLVDKISGEGYVVGRKAITDRNKVRTFLEMINRSGASYRFILLDVFFEDPSPEDSLLQAELDRHPRLIIPYHLSPQGTPRLPLFKAQSGLADYSSMEKHFLKYSLVSDTCRSLPLVMHERISGERMTKGSLWWYLGEKRVFNTFILPFFIRKHQLSSENSGISYMYLEDFFHLGDPDFIAELVKDRILVLGDFSEQDFHPTIMGEQPGALILTNVYQSLRSGINTITLPFLLYLSGMFLLLSLLLVFPHERIRNSGLFRRLGKARMNWITHLIFSLLGWFFLLFLISFLSTLFFHISLSILLLSFYFLAVQKLKERYEV